MRGLDVLAQAPMTSAGSVTRWVTGLVTAEAVAVVPQGTAEDTAAIEAVKDAATLGADRPHLTDAEVQVEVEVQIDLHSGVIAVTVVTVRTVQSAPRS